MRDLQGYLHQFFPKFALIDYNLKVNFLIFDQKENIKEFF